MAAIGSELLRNVNACQARWMTHLVGDVNAGRPEHASNYLRDCRRTYAAHQVGHAQPDGIGGFMQLSGMGDYLDPQQQQAVQVGNTQIAQQQAMFSARAQLQQAQAECKQAAWQAQAIGQAAQGTNPKAAGNAFYRCKHKLKKMRKKLARCRARCEALEAGKTPAQAEVAAVQAAPPTSPSDTAGLSGLGFAATQGSGIPQQYQQVESRPDWAGDLPAQSIAEGYAYRFPSTESAFIERGARIVGGHGGVYTGEAAPFSYYQHAAQQGAFQKPWTNPWSYSQFFDNTSQGLPIWGGGYTQPFRPTQIPPGGTSWGAQPPVAGAGQRPAPPDPLAMLYGGKNCYQMPRVFVEGCLAWQQANNATPAQPTMAERLARLRAGTLYPAQRAAQQYSQQQAAPQYADPGSAVERF